MSLTSRKITNFAKKVTDLPDRPSPAYTPSQIKSQFDSSPEELRVAQNGLIDDLSSVTAGSSGAEQVGSAPITGVTGTTVYGQLSDIKTQIETNANNFGKVTVAGQSDVVADAKADTLTLAGGTGITVTTNPATDTVTITATGNATPGAHASSHITGGTDVIPNAVASGNAGLLSGADKAALDQTVSGLATHVADYTLQVPYGGITTGVANTYVLAAPTITALTTGMAVSVKFNVDSSGASTLNWNGKGAKGIKKSNGTDVTNLKATGIYTLRYDGTNFILQGEGGEYGTAVAGDVVAPKTIGTDTGLVTGTITDRGTTANQTLTAQNQAFTVNAGYHRQTFSVTATYTAGPLTASGSATSNTSNVVTVTGLGFQPKIVLIKQASVSSNNSDYGTYVDITKFSSPPTSGINDFDSSTDIAGAFTITASGFTLTTNIPSADFKYIAIA